MVAAAVPAGWGRAAVARGRWARSVLWRVFLSLISGLALAAAFPPWDAAPLVVVGPAFLALALRGAPLLQRAGIGLVFGLAFFGALLIWAERFGLHAWVMLTLTQAGFAVLLGAAAGAVLGYPKPMVSAVGWAGLWVLIMEAARGRFPLGGFPWGALGAPLVGTPADALAPVAGGIAVSALAAFASGLLVLAARGSLKPALVGVAAIAVLVVGAGALGPPPPDGRRLAVAVVQGDVPLPAAPASPERTAEVLTEHVALTRTIPPGALDLVVWPEDVVDLGSPRPVPGEEAPQPLAGLARRVDAWMLAGITSAVGPDRFLNSAVSVDPSGRIAGVYDKIRPVPFGEYVPGRRFLGFVTALRAVPRDMIPGDAPRALPLAGGLVGTPISYETAFARIVRRFVQLGAELVVVPTNTSSYGPGAATAEQELQLTRMRAVELDRWVVQAAPSGISAFIDPRGRVVARTGLYEPALLRGEVRLGDHLTPFVRWGEGPAILAASFAVLVCVAPSVRGWFRGPSGTPRRRRGVGGDRNPSS